MEFINESIKIDKETIEFNEKVLAIPDYLEDDDKKAYSEIIKKYIEFIEYKLSPTQVKYIWKICKLEIMRKKAWEKWNKSPEKENYKILKKCEKRIENEVNKTYTECEKQTEKIFANRKLNP